MHEIIYLTIPAVILYTFMWEHNHFPLKSNMKSSVSLYPLIWHLFLYFDQSMSWTLPKHWENLNDKFSMGRRIIQLYLCKIYIKTQIRGRLEQKLLFKCVQLFGERFLTAHHPSIPFNPHYHIKCTFHADEAREKRSLIFRLPMN